jgi:ABC-2 type transport system ATP-binding protein
MSAAAVEIVGLVKRYGDKVAVDGLSLQVAARSVTAILGPNGAGKTTTIECCEGFRRPDQGTVRVLGLDPATAGDALRPRVGVMLQSGGIYPTVKAEKILRHTARLYANPINPALLIEWLGLGSAGRTPFRRLSGGEQQRLSLALAVVGRPELVFLDEPTAGLDPHARLATWELIRQMRTDGVTVVLTTHLMDEAERLADQVFIADHGRIVTSGSPAELTAPGAERALRFSARAGLDTVSLMHALAPGSRATEISSGGYLVEGDVGPRLLADVTAWCAEHDVMAEDIHYGRRTLEDVFLELTGHELRA